MKVLIVCSGNICRSPMAAAYLRQRLARTGSTHVLVDSAGTLGIEGAPAAHEAIVAMGEIGVPLADHRSRGLKASDLRSSDLVVAMDHGHLETLAQRWPEGRERRVLWRAFEHTVRPATDPPDLADPMGSDLAEFRRQRELICACGDHLALYLKHLAGAVP